ncbi:MAG: hypothetical protein ACRYG8_36180 [Janthinobacterium lividum]
MRIDPNRYAVQNDPDRNYNFHRFATARPLTARELELAADIEMASGNLRRADMLSWKAHLARTEASPTRQEAP